MNRPTHKTSSLPDVVLVSIHVQSPYSANTRNLVNVIYVAINTTDPLLSLRIIQCLFSLLKGQESIPINKGLWFCEIHRICFLIFWLPHSFSANLKAKLFQHQNFRSGMNKYKRTTSSSQIKENISRRGDMIIYTFELRTTNDWSVKQRGRKEKIKPTVPRCPRWTPRGDRIVHHQRGEREREVPWVSPKTECERFTPIGLMGNIIVKPHTAVTTAHVP